MTQQNDYRNYSKVSDDDWDFIEEQEPSVMQLWIACMKADKFGESYGVLKTNLSRPSFERAKKILEVCGLFEFLPIEQKTPAGRRKIVGWKVRNLHGSKVKSYWQRSE